MQQLNKHFKNKMHVGDKNCIGHYVFSILQDDLHFQYSSMQRTIFFMESQVSND